MKYVILVLGLVAVAVLLWLVVRKPRESAVELVPTYDGPIARYDGKKTLLVAVYARWAGVWRVTAEALAQVDRDHYDLKLINVDQDKAAVRDLDLKIIPTVLVFQDGREVARLPNMMSLDQLPQP